MQAKGHLCKVTERIQGEIQSNVTACHMYGLIRLSPKWKQSQRSVNKGKDRSLGAGEGVLFKREGRTAPSFSSNQQSLVAKGEGKGGVLG
jgi:hypothetical protein